MKQIRVLLIGLGRMGNRFYEKFSEVGEERVKIVAVCETDPNNPNVIRAVEDGVVHYLSYREAIEHYQEQIDIIMDTSNRPEVKQEIRQILEKSGNRHTVLIPMVVDYLMWYLLPNAGEIPQDHREIGY